MKYSFYDSDSNASAAGLTVIHMSVSEGFTKKTGTGILYCTRVSLNAHYIQTFESCESNVAERAWSELLYLGMILIFTRSEMFDTCGSVYSLKFNNCSVFSFNSDQFHSLSTVQYFV